MARDKDLKKANEETLEAWEGTIRKHRDTQVARNKRADELIRAQEATEQRTGKNLKNYKDALRETRSRGAAARAGGKKPRPS